MSSSNGHGRHLVLDLLCRACRAGGDPRKAPTPFAHLHQLCDPVTYFCACPCDTGELDDPREHP